MYGLEINAANGDEGWIEISGLGARPAIMRKWSLERRGVPGPDGPVWGLRASLAYHNDALLRNEGLTKRIVIVVRNRSFDDNNRDVGKVVIKQYECVLEEGSAMRIDDGDRLVVEGVHLCQIL